MSQIIVSKRYAKALFQLSDRLQVIEKVDQELNALAIAYQESEELQKVLIDTKISQENKAEILRSMLKSIKAQNVTQNFVLLLLEKRRIFLLPVIRKLYSEKVMEKLGQINAEVTVSAELTQGQVQLFEKQLSAKTGKTVFVTVKVDPMILGGVITRMGSLVVDGSIRNHLNQIYQSIQRG